MSLSKEDNTYNFADRFDERAFVPLSLIAAVDELVTQFTSGEAEVTDEGLSMTNMPPFIDRRLGQKPSITKTGNLFRKLINLVGRVREREQRGPDQSP